MKNLLLLLALTLTLLSCDKGTFKGKDQLPAETQTGANTVGCLVNGQVFLPNAECINPEVNCFYQLVDGEYFFNMAFSDLRGTGVKTVSVRTSKINLETNGNYILDQENTIFEEFVGGGGVYGINAANYFYTSTLKTGELKIIKLDPVNAIISGTFWFDAVNSAGETVEIRQGRFDWNY